MTLVTSPGTLVTHTLFPSNIAAVNEAFLISIFDDLFFRIKTARLNPPKSFWYRRICYRKFFTREPTPSKCDVKSWTHVRFFLSFELVYPEGVVRGIRVLDEGVSVKDRNIA